jgi:hypothetical protein
MFRSYDHLQAEMYTSEINTTGKKRNNRSVVSRQPMSLVAMLTILDSPRPLNVRVTTSELESSNSMCNLHFILVLD